MELFSSASVTETERLGASAPARLPAKALDQQDFLKLLVAQLSMQDPLNPKKDTEFIAQIAQFSALEQAKAMQADMAQLRSQQQLLQANALLGRKVELQMDAQTRVSGVVSAIQIEAGIPKIVVNSRAYDLETLVSVSPTENRGAALQARGAARQAGIQAHPLDRRRAGGAEDRASERLSQAAKDLGLLPLDSILSPK